MSAGHLRFDKIHERPQRRRQPPPPRVVQERAGKRLPPVFEQGLQRAAVQMRAKPVFEQIHNADTGQRGFHGKIRGGEDASWRPAFSRDERHRLCAVLSAGGGFTPLQSSTPSDTAQRLGATPLQVALAWLLHRAPNVLLIPGTSSLQHLQEYLAAAGLTLSGETLAQLGASGG